MIYRILGKSNLKVSVVGFGGIPVQRISIEEAKAVILKAEDLGINFIDSAKGYTVSEDYIGHALKGRREKWILATKSMARDFETMSKDIETSLKSFRTKYIDLYQIHNAKTKEEYDKIFSENGAYKALEQAKVDGKIGHIGITSHSLDILKIAIESGKFETIMYPYNIVEKQAEKLFQRATELNIGVIAMKPLAGGAIQDGTLAIKYILNNKNVTTAIPGMATANEVEQNVEAANNFVSLSQAEKDKASIISEELGSEFCRRCGYCGPCPQGIDIPSMFLFEGYKKRYDLSTWAEDRYFNCSKTAKDCVECGACEKKCPYNLPIRNMLKDVKKSFNDF